MFNTNLKNTTNAVTEFIRQWTMICVYRCSSFPTLTFKTTITPITINTTITPVDARYLYVGSSNRMKEQDYHYSS